MVALFAGDFENALIWHLNWFGYACISCKNGLTNEVGLLAFKSGLNIVSKNLLASNYRYAIVELPIMIALGG